MSDYTKNELALLDLTNDINKLFDYVGEEDDCDDQTPPKTMDEGSVAAYFTRGSWSSTSSIRAAALKLSSTKGELG